MIRQNEPNALEGEKPENQADSPSTNGDSKPSSDPNSASVPELGARKSGFVRFDGQCEAVTLRGDRCSRRAAVGTLCRRHAAAPLKPAKCTCKAYKWPHRPGGGLCRWPEPPQIEYPTPAGTHSRRRKPTAPAFARNAGPLMGMTCKTVTSGRPWMIRQDGEAAPQTAKLTETTIDFVRGTNTAKVKTWPATRDEAENP